MKYRRSSGGEERGRFARKPRIRPAPGGCVRQRAAHRGAPGAFAFYTPNHYSMAGGGCKSAFFAARRVGEGAFAARVRIRRPRAERRRVRQKQLRGRRTRRQLRLKRERTSALPRSPRGFSTAEKRPAPERARTSDGKLDAHFSASSTSERVGMLAAAPGRVTEMAEALLARRSASSTSAPSAMAAKKKPVKVSPAAVVSTAFTR